MRHLPKRPAFTALQLILVLAVMAFFFALVAPLAARIRESAARVQSINNLRQMAFAMHSHHDTFKRMPPGVGTANKQTGPAHFHILPFLDQPAIYNAADGASWKNGTYSYIVAVYIDPRDRSTVSPLYKNWLATTSYPVNWMVTKEGGMKLTDITDGTSNTLMIAQRYQMCNGTPTAWGYPSLHTWAPIFAYYSEGKFQSAPSQEQCDPRLPQSMGRGILVALCDGSARAVSDSVAPM